MIPKIIHYVWVGGTKQPALVKKCIESWKRYAPDYELRFWNEENSPMDHPYVKEMYAKKKWAFVSDYIRFWALEREGGIYLDTDMELLKSLDSFLDNEAFLGRSKSGHASAGIIGTTPHHPFLQKIVEFYEHDTEFNTNNTSPLVIEKVLHENSFPSVAIYGPEYFYPFDDGERCTSEMLETAYAVHHWAESWVPLRRTRKVLRRLGILALIKKVSGRI